MTEQDWGVNIIHDSTKPISNDPISLTHTPLPNMKVFGALKRKPSLPPESLLWMAVIKTVRKRLPKAARVQTNVDQSLHNQDRQNESHLRWETRDALRAPQEYKHPDSSWPLSLSLLPSIFNADAFLLWASILVKIWHFHQTPTHPHALPHSLSFFHWFFWTRGDFRVPDQWWFHTESCGVALLE